MAEYITKEAAIEAFEWGDADVIEDYGDGCDFGFSRGAIKSAISSIPAADVAPVVRCEDCKHLCVWNRKDMYAFCQKTNIAFLPFELDTRTFSCSLGERKDGGADHV